jgi:hypothetical protein
MHKTYLLDLLQKLTSKQMKDLSEFIQSPFFNKNESVTKLFEYLRVQHPEFKEQEIEKEHIHKKLFHSAEYSDGFMRMLIFKLTSLAEEYLAYADFKTSGHSENFHLINTLLNLNIDSEAQKQINQLEKKLNSDKTQNGSYYKNRYELEKFKDIIYSRTYRAVTIKDKPDERMLEESNNLSAFFLISVLQRYRYLLNKSFTVNTDFKLDFLPYIIDFLEGDGKHYLNILLVSLLYKQILVINDYNREDLIDDLIHDLTNDKLTIENEERREGLTVMNNICIEKGYEGKEKYFRYMFDIDKYLVAKNLYNRVRGGYFDNEMFLNVVTIGLKLEEISWIKNFIEKYYTKLAPDTQMNTYNYCNAKLYFKTKDFNRALDNIARVAYSDMHMKMNVRITAITIHYELGNIEEVLTQIENFKKYIQNDKLMNAGHKRISSNFIKYTAALCKAKYSNKVNLEELKKNVAATDQISNRVWLIKKANELVELRRSFNKA